MPGLMLGIVLATHIAAVVACILVCRHYLKRCQASADDANDAAHDAYNYIAGLVPTDNKPGTEQPAQDADTPFDDARPDNLTPDDDPTLFLPPVGGHHVHEDDPDVLFTHGQQLRAQSATGKHHLTDDHPPRRPTPTPRHQHRP